MSRAAYAVVASELADLGSSQPAAAAGVAVSRAGGLLRIDVAIGPAPSAETDLTDVVDRVGAAGGTYHRTQHGGFTTVTVVIPCGS